jgi:hypothetical protein
MNFLKRILGIFIIYYDQFDWSDGTFIYASSTCFDPILMESMCQKALLLEKNSYFISLTKPLKPED